MSILLLQNPLSSEEELMERCCLIEGLSVLQLAASLQIAIPVHKLQRKGWMGLAIEKILGATAGNKAVPDFDNLDIELKTLPLNAHNKPSESTFVTSIPLLTIHQQSWLSSQCYAKLKRVLWLPIEGDRNIPFEHRRIGKGFLWSPSQAEAVILAEDWNEITLLIATGRLDELNARIGQYLQVRPKAQNAKSLCYGYDNEGKKILTLPRGFYLRSSFTALIIKNSLINTSLLHSK